MVLPSRHFPCKILLDQIQDIAAITSSLVRFVLKLVHQNLRNNGCSFRKPITVQVMKELFGDLIFVLFLNFMK